MNARMNVLGIDGGFASLGWAVAALDGLDEGERLLGVGCIITVKDKKTVLATVDNIRRARLLAKGLQSVIEEHKPSAIAVEAMSWPRSSSVVAKMGIAWGVVITLADLHRLPIVSKSPQEVKLAMCGKENASKTEVRNAVLAHPGFIRLAGMLDKADFPPGRYEHPQDACAVILASLDTEIIRAIRQVGTR